MNYTKLLNRLINRHGTLYKVSKESGVKYATLHALHTGRSNDPRMSTYDALLKLDGTKESRDA